MGCVFRKAKKRGVETKSFSAEKQFISKINSKQYTYQELPCLCGAHEDVLLATKDRYGFDINTVICKKCGLIRANPYYAPKTLEEFYSEEYREIYTGSEIATDDFFNDQVKTGKWYIENLEKNIKIEPGMKVFEIGCGAGGILYAFKERGCDVFGCDYGEKYLHYGQQKGITTKKGGYEALKEFGQADIIILSHVLEHIVDPIDFLKNISCLLKKTGVLYVIVPSIEVIPVWYDNDIFKYLQNAHAYYFSDRTLKSVLEAAGYAVKSTPFLGFCIAEKSENKSKRMEDENEYARAIKLLKSYENECAPLFGWRKKNHQKTFFFLKRPLIRKIKENGVKQIYLFSIKIYQRRIHD